MSLQSSFLDLSGNPSYKSSIFHTPPLWIGVPEALGADDEDDEDDEDKDEDEDEVVEGAKERVGMSNVAVELTLSRASGRRPSLSPSSSSRFSGAFVHAAALVVVRFVVVVPTMPQPVKVALYNSLHTEDLLVTEDDVGSNSVQVLKISVTVVFWFSSQLLRLLGSPVAGPQPPERVHFGPLQICIHVSTAR
jgi:hypothetical protein